MLIRSLRLVNIRSYTDRTVAFSEGTTLLAGDIGSGKSTILLALEFALFGIQRGELSGAALLRHGARTGSVTLSVRIAEREVTITRTLKRSENAIGQDTGSLTIDGVTTEYTAQELKAHILSLLNYPSSLLKGKGPLFRYTVYTPQAQMQAILFEEPDARLETLRKLFDIDKYKRVRENTMLLLRELRKRENELLVRIEELGKDVKEEGQKRQALVAAKAELQTNETTAKEVKTALLALRAALDELERKRFVLEEQKKHHAVAQARVESIRQRAADLERERLLLSRQIEETEKNLVPADADESALKEEERTLKEALLGFKEKERALLRREAALDATIMNANATINGIVPLAQCPTCLQPVTAEHKEHIKDEEQKKVDDATQKRSRLAEMRLALQTEERDLEARKTTLTQKLRLAGATREKLASLRGLKERLVANEATRRQLLLQEQEAGAQVKTYAQRLAETVGIDEEEHRNAKRRVDEMTTRASAAFVAVAQGQKDVERLELDLTRIAARQLEQQTHADRLRTTRQRIVWLEKQFLGVAHAIEKTLFSSVYGLFNACFRDWFAMLLEDESLSVRLDAEFTPIIVQDGYETDLDHLSGGEKTSVALAYRLALNKSVNDFLSAINTRDLLVLDEPTDGFSSEQLDRVREVLSQLRLRQIILVSHEAQLEGYVDHVLRVRKRDHESEIVA